MHHRKLLTAVVGASVLTVSIFHTGAVGAEAVTMEAQETVNEVKQMHEVKSYRHIILGDVNHLRKEVRAVREHAKEFEETIVVETEMAEAPVAVALEAETVAEVPAEYVEETEASVGTAVYEEPSYEEEYYEEDTYEDYTEGYDEEGGYTEEVDYSYSEEETYSEEYNDGNDAEESGYDRAYVSADELDLLAAIIQCEAGGESYEGKVAVGAVVLNRMDSSLYPNDMSEVIYQPWQFTPAMTGNLQSVLASGARADCYEAAEAALSGENPVGDCLYFHAGGGAGLTIGNQTFY